MNEVAIQFLKLQMENKLLKKKIAKLLVQKGKEGE